MQICCTSPADPAAAQMLGALSQTLTKITGESGESWFDPADVGQPAATFVVAFDEFGAALGCGAYRSLSPGIAEIKRMYAAPATCGIGAAILDYLEKSAPRDGYGEILLETAASKNAQSAFTNGTATTRSPTSQICRTTRSDLLREENFLATNATLMPPFAIGFALHAWRRRAPCRRAEAALRCSLRRHKSPVRC